MRYTYGNGKYYDLFAGPASYNIDGNDKQVNDIVVSSTTITITIADNGAGIPVSGTIYYRIYAERKL